MKYNSDLVSIIVPVYNAEKFLSDTVRSVFAQKYSQWELLLVIDAKTKDSSRALARKFAAEDRRVRVIAGKMRGVAQVRNRGIKAAKGKYIAFLDSDDYWHRDKLAKQILFIRKTDAAFTCTAFRRWAPSGKIGRKIQVPRVITHHRLLQGNCILCSSVLVDREKTGGFEFKEMGCEDYALWLGFLRQGFLCTGLNQELVVYRMVKGSRGSNKLKTLIESWNIYRQGEKMSLWKASYALVPFLARNLEKYARF